MLRTAEGKYQIQIRGCLELLKVNIGYRLGMLRTAEGKNWIQIRDAYNC